MCVSTHTLTQPSGEQLHAAGDAQTGLGSFISQEISLRLSGFPCVKLGRLSRLLVSLLSHAFHIPGISCV